MSNLRYKAIVNSLFQYGKIKTTKAKAQSAQSLAEKLVTTAKQQTLAARRHLDKFLSEKTADKLFLEAKDLFSSRPSGFTRLTKIGARLSDTAQMVYLELIKDKTEEEPRHSGNPAASGGIQNPILDKPE